MTKMDYTYNRPLSEDELLGHLRSHDDDRIVLRVPGLRWQEIERQVERLGYGDLFLVSSTKGCHGECCRIDPSSRVRD
jgi:hypothetical protein